MQQRYGAGQLAVVLVDVDPEYFPNPADHLPEAKKILAKRKLDWPNVLAPKGFHDTARVFNVSGYGTILLDADGIVRGVNLHGEDLERRVDEIMHVKKTTKPRSNK